MRERPAGATLPRIRVVDLRRAFARGNRSIFSRELERPCSGWRSAARRRCSCTTGAASRPSSCAGNALRAHLQALLTALTYHERTHTLECHTCGAVYHVRSYPAPGSSCPKCGSRYLAKMGLGTQQVEDALRALMPGYVEVIRMDADSTRGKDGHRRLLERFDAAECAVLLGTQMIAKGLDFPEVTLVGVVNADYALKMPDFRAGERAFDLLEQVAGRAGRGERPGEVIIQTYLPDDPVIRAVAAHDRSVFIEHDRAQRAAASYPPFVRPRQHHLLERAGGRRRGPCRAPGPRAALGVRGEPARGFCCRLGSAAVRGGVRGVFGSERPRGRRRAAGRGRAEAGSRGRGGSGCPVGLRRKGPRRRAGQRPRGCPSLDRRASPAILRPPPWSSVPPPA